MSDPARLAQAVLVAERSGLEWLLYGHVTVPYWLVALVAGLAITGGLVYFSRRLPKQ